MLEEHKAKEFMETIYPKFKRQYLWFKATQWGEIGEYDSRPNALGFRWRGKKGMHILTSGFGLL
jgi:mannosyl-oligosaccharide glucosidase